MKLRVNPIAARDLEEIKDYITNTLQNPIAAENTVSAIVKRYKALPDMPKIGTPLRTKTTIPTDSCRMGTYNYMIFYKIEGEFVRVYRILYGRRDYLKILFDEGE